MHLAPEIFLSGPHEVRFLIAMPDSNVTLSKSPAISEHPLYRWFHRHQQKLWWLHSFYALVLGIGFMWLGKRNFTYLRVAVFYIGFIWLSSLFLPKLLNHPHLPPPWPRRIHLLINFLNQNFYQQMLFFVLPIYYASATLGSPNISFVALVGLSATLSTLDVVYDRHLSVKRSLTAVFFAFSLFALINVMLPVLWSVSNARAMRISAMLAFLGFVTLYYRTAQWRARSVALVLLVALLLLGLVEWGRPFIPPAPLRLGDVQFGRAIQQESLQIESPVTELPPAAPLQLYGLTAIKAPLGLEERVRHRWYETGKLLCASPFYSITGGREKGFRLWTSCTLSSIVPGTVLRLDLETEGGQLIGRAELQAGK
jgi:hypothetical protein